MFQKPLEGYADPFVGAKEAADSGNLSDLERKHIPVVEAPETVRKGEHFDVRVEVGKLVAHQSEHAHSIQFVDLYADGTFLARAHLAAGVAWPSVVFRVSLEHPAEELMAYAYCNMHGTWRGRKAIAVTE